MGKDKKLLGTRTEMINADCLGDVGITLKTETMDYQITTSFSKAQLIGCFCHHVYYSGFSGGAELIEHLLEWLIDCGPAGPI